MKVGLLGQSGWLDHELTTLRRLIVGLVEKRIRPVRIVPEAFGQQAEGFAMSVETLTYRDSAWPWIRRWRLDRLAPRLRELDLDIIHAMDGSLQEPAMTLGRKLDVPVICSCWSLKEIQGLKPLGAPVPVTYTAPTLPLEQRLQDVVGGSVRSRLLRPGVYSSMDQDAAQALSSPDTSLCALVVGSGEADDAYAALLAGMSRIQDRVPQGLYFLRGLSGEQHRLWQMARGLNLLNQVTMVPDELSTRQLLVQADVLIQPQARSAVRTLVLEAMLCERPVIAAADPLVDFLIHDRTARLLQRPRGAQWAQCLMELATQPQRFRQWGRSAREYVRENHSVTDFASRHVELYEEATSLSVGPERV